MGTFLINFVLNLFQRFLWIGILGIALLIGGIFYSPLIIAGLIALALYVAFSAVGSLITLIKFRLLYKGAEAIDKELNKDEYQK